MLPTLQTSRVVVGSRGTVRETGRGYVPPVWVWRCYVANQQLHVALLLHQCASAVKAHTQLYVCVPCVLLYVCALGYARILSCKFVHMLCAARRTGEQLLLSTGWNVFKTGYWTHCSVGIGVGCYDMLIRQVMHCVQKCRCCWLPVMYGDEELWMFCKLVGW